MMNHDFMIRTFLDLVRIDSLSLKEGALSRKLESDLSALGLSVTVDRAGEAVGGETGNLVARFPGDPAVPPFLLCAHMDTVGPGEGIRPIVEKERIVTDGRTILGGDDKSGLVVILEVLRRLKEQGIPHGDIEVLLTFGEETGLLGARHLDATGLRAKTGLVLDSDNPLELTVQAPAADHLTVTVEGTEAHAGCEPEKGVSAILLAAKALSRMRLGRIDKETTANIGRIEGGTARNIIPAKVVLTGEARSHKASKLAAQVRHMRDCFARAAAEGRGKATFLVERAYPALTLARTSALARLLQRAARDLGHGFGFRSSGGGSDANILLSRGITVANLGTGMREVHTVREWLDLKDFFLSADLVTQALRLHAENSSKG